MIAYDVKRLGFHRQKDSGIAQVLLIAPKGNVAGIDSDGDASIWDFDGECLNKMAGENYDLVEYLGGERPARAKE
jgi:hypothetical protein